MSLPEDSICRIEELEMHVENPSDIVKKKREDYAEIACLMFLPFRQSMSCVAVAMIKLIGERLNKH